MKKRVSILLSLFICFLFLVVTANFAAAKESKIGTISIQEILSESKSGQAAQKKLEEKMLAFQSKFQKEQEGLEKMKGEIEKKGTVWSLEVKKDKERDYQKKLRDFQMKSEDAKYELQQLEKKILEPILKDLHDIIDEVGKREGYAVILEYTMKGLQSRSGLLFAQESIDISDMIRVELDKRQAKKK